MVYDFGLQRYRDEKIRDCHQDSTPLELFQNIISNLNENKTETNFLLLLGYKALF